MRSGFKLRAGSYEKNYVAGREIGAAMQFGKGNEWGAMKTESDDVASM